MAETEPLLLNHQTSDMHPAYASHTDAHQATPLELWRNAIGIGPRTPYYLTSKSPPAEDSFPRGLYKRILGDYRKLQMQYFLFDGVLTTSLITQLVVGATLTALGPSAGDHPRAITILGAVNTGIAGLLGLLKGNGLPDRMRKDAFELRKVLDYIEEMDAELSSGVLLSPSDIVINDPIDDHDPSTGPKPSAPPSISQTTDDHNRRAKEREEVLAIVQEVIKKYEAARDTAENNRPDNYVQSGGTSASPSSRV